MAILADTDRTVLALVSRPDPLALGEAARAAVELGALGVANQRLVVNGVYPDPNSDDPLAAARCSTMPSSGLTRPAVPCSRRTSARRAPPRSRCSGPSWRDYDRELAGLIPKRSGLVA